jgi:hypothetical protein
VTINPPLYGADTPQSFFDEKLDYGWNLRHLEVGGEWFQRGGGGLAGFLRRPRSAGAGRGATPPLRRPPLAPHPARLNPRPNPRPAPQGCLLHERRVPHIPGVTTPMTYFGMWKRWEARGGGG